jgi:predicted  nucleic acid-binding Zn-ribbon protein
MTTRMQQRRGTSTQWTNANPVLAAGEIGFETDSNKFKIGDGTSTWSLLQYFINLDGLDIDVNGFVKDTKIGVANGVAALDANGTIPTAQLPASHIGNLINGSIAAIVGAAPDALNTLNEISAAFNNDPNYADTVTAGLDLKAPKANPTFTGTVTLPAVDGSDNSTKAATTEFVNTKISATNQNVSGLSTTVTNLISTVNTNQETNEERLGNLETDLNESNSNIQSVTSSLETVSSEVSANSSSISNLQTSVSGNTQSITQLGESLDATDADIVSLQTSVSENTQSITELDTSLNGTNADVAALESSVSSIQTSLSEVETDLGSVSTKANTAEADIVTLKSKATTGETHIAGTTNVHGIADTAALATKSYADNAKTDAISTSATAIALKANIASPALTGTPTAPTASVGTNTTQIATTAFVKAEVDAVIAAAPGALNTLDELAAALGDDANFATTVTTNLAAKAPSANPTLTGTVALPAASSVTLGGTALSTTLATKADNNSVINVMSGSHTIATADVNNIREMSNGGTISIPADNSFWPVGAVVDVIQTGSSQVTVAGGAGVTVNATPGLKLRAQWSSATILKRAANTFVVMGDLSA